VTDVAIVGAGALGLSCAAALAGAGKSVVLVERRDGIARETTSRNSEVIHAGLYYPQDSLKAKFCIEGRDRLYARCSARQIGHRRVGKTIVATNEAERDSLEALAANADRCGVRDLIPLTAEELNRREPSVRGIAALWSPSTGIVDAHGLCVSWLAEAESHGAVLALCTTLREIEKKASGYLLRIADNDGKPADLEAEVVINAAGLDSDRVAASAGIDIDEAGYRLHLCKGDYFSLLPGAPYGFSGLVYPLHGAAGLGVHVTFDLAGRVRLGPDATYVEDRNLDVDPGKAEAFAAAAGRYLPGLDASQLAPDYAGLRPKLAAPGEGFRDFVVAEESRRGLPGLINLIGIESPGLTAAAAIAAHVAERLL
jgi:L-2-hydroxyglutarate oxidase LhgO